MPENRSFVKAVSGPPMKPWFTVERLSGDTFALSEYSHWEETHCYLLLGEDRALLIDTGLGVGNLQKEVERITALPVTAALTHAHWDHIGGLCGFSNFSMHGAERPWLTERFPLPPAAVMTNLLKEPCEFPDGFRPEAYQIFRGKPTRLLQEGDVLSLGGREVAALHTPGHSPGHLCFWEPDRGWLYTGDLLYGGKLDMFYPTTDPGEFYRSVQRVAALPVKRLLPGHRGLDIPVSLAEEAERAFACLEREGKLFQGAGVFPFDGFSIHL